MANYDNTNSGVLFKNDKKGNEKAPDYKGKINFDGKDMDLAAWVRTGEKGSFLSLKVSEPMKKDGGSYQKQTSAPKPKAAPVSNDDLPF